MQDIYLEYEDIYIQPLGRTALSDHQRFLKDIYKLFSDNETLRFIPEKRITDPADAEKWLWITLLNGHCGRNQIYLIIKRSSGGLLGMIDIIPPSVAREHYELNEYPYFIEFYLKSSASGRSLMSTLLPILIEQLQKRGIRPLAAVVDRGNIPARKVLSRSGFALEQSFDRRQDLYSLSA